MAHEAFRGTSRSWVFTWNNYPADAYDQLLANRANFHACFVGKEVAASGTPHLQGVLIAKKPCRLGFLTRLLPNVHFEVMRGSEAQAVAYTKKEGNPDRLDWDDRHQGSRTDLAAVTALVQANPRIAVRAVAQAMPTSFVRFHGGVTALARALLPVPPFFSKRHVKWFYGPTGCGKSYNALREAIAAAGGDESNVFRWTVRNLKFPGNYNGEEYVVIDELRTVWEHFTFSGLLTLLDDYRCETELKGGQVFWAPKMVWITTPLHPHEFITDEERRGNPQAIRQLSRRIDEVRLYDVPYEPPPPPDDHICPDSDPDVGQPVRHAPTPPLPRAGPPLPPTQPSDPVSEPDEDAESMLRRAAAFRATVRAAGLPEDPITDSDSDIVFSGFR